MTKKNIHTIPRKILTYLGLVAVLFLSFHSHSSPNFVAGAGSVPAFDQTQIADIQYTVSTYFNHNIPDEVIMAEEVVSDDDLLDGICPIDHFLFEQTFNTRQPVFIAHNNETAHNRHLYLLYCSWRHFTIL